MLAFDARTGGGARWRDGAALVGRAALRRISFSHLFAFGGEVLERVGAILDGADDVAVHAVAVVARVAGRHEVAVAVRLAVQRAAELSSARHGRRRAAAAATAARQVGGVAIVAHGAADAVEQDGRASLHLQDALLHDAGRVVADAVAQVARFVGIRRHLGAVAVEQAVDHAALRFAEVDAARWRHHRLRRSECRRHGRPNAARRR